MYRVAIGMGSNIGNPQDHLNAACVALRAHPLVHNFRCSTFLITSPVGLRDQPDFLNAAATFETTLLPEPLLDALLIIEQSRGRNRANEQRWGPRTLDLDILLFADQVIASSRLNVPHIQMKTRRFVLEPLAQIAADWIVPPTNQTVQDLRDALDGRC